MIGMDDYLVYSTAYLNPLKEVHCVSQPIIMDNNIIFYVSIY